MVRQTKNSEHDNTSSDTRKDVIHKIMWFVFVDINSEFMILLNKNKEYP
jgi:hypothetical protein